MLNYARSLRLASWMEQVACLSAQECPDERALTKKLKTAFTLINAAGKDQNLPEADILKLKQLSSEGRFPEAGSFLKPLEKERDALRDALRGFAPA